MIRAVLVAGLAVWGGHAQAASWTVDPAKSSITFTGSQSGQPFTGAFKSFAAAIDFDPAQPASAHVRVTVDMASAATGDAQKDELLPGVVWFDTASFPKAVFEATGFKALGGDNYEADGTLTIRDVSKPLALPFTLTIGAGIAHAVGKVQLLRSTFGVGQAAWSNEDYVAFAVDVGIDLMATAKP